MILFSERNGVLMKKFNKTSPVLFYVSVCLLFFVMLTSYFTSGLYARYTNASFGNDGASVAAFVFNVEDKNGTHYLDLKNIKKPGDKAVYVFEVSNKNGGAISEVEQKYTVTITASGNMPITCELKNGETSVSAATGGSCNITGSFVPGSEQTATFTLTVEWPSNKNEASYANGAAFATVKLSIISQQVD